MTVDERIQKLVDERIQKLVDERIQKLVDERIQKLEERVTALERQLEGQPDMDVIFSEMKNASFSSCQKLVILFEGNRDHIHSYRRYGVRKTFLVYRSADLFQKFFVKVVPVNVHGYTSLLKREIQRSYNYFLYESPNIITQRREMS